jgi:hypothetical protein
MHIHYPHHHSHHPDMAVKAVRPICTYCLHLLGVGDVQLNAAMRHLLEEDHQCLEKVTARQPHVALPFN